MHLIDVTNSYKDLVHSQLNSTNESNEAIEIALENHDRRIRKEEAEFVIKRLIKEDDPYYVITFDKNQQLIEINIDK